MNEFISSIAIIWCIIFYWLGGQELPFIKKGKKWLRRYVLPIGLCIFLITLGAQLEASIFACVGLSIALHLGYQNSVWKFATTGFLMGLPTMIFGVYWTTFLPMIAHTVFGYLSLKDNNFRWAWVAIIQGVSIGLCYLYPLGTLS